MRLRTLRWAAVAAVICVAASATRAMQSPTARELFERARLMEAAKQDPAEVIKLYRQAADAAEKNDPALAAEAGAAADRLGSTEAQAGVPFESRDIEALVTKDEYFGAIIPHVSPDGKMFSFLKVHGPRTNTPNVSIWVRNLATGDERELVPDLKGDRPWDSWSDDGRRLAVSLRILDGDRTRREIYVIDLAPGGPAPIRLKSLDGSRAQIYGMFQGWLAMQWSPDGRWLAYVATTDTENIHEARLLDVRSGETKSLGPLTILPTDATQVLNSPANMPPNFQWSADSSELAVAIGDAATNSASIRLVRVADGRTRTLRVPPSVGPRFALRSWTNQGLSLQSRMPAAGMKLITLAPDSGQATVVCEQQAAQASTGRPRLMSLRATDTDLCIRITADGSLLRWDGATQRIMVKDLPTGREQPLTAGGAGEERSPQLSLDEKTVVFVSNRDGRWSLYAAPLAMAPVANPVLIARLDTLPSNLGMRPTGDGLVMNASYWESDVWRVDVDSTTGLAVGEPQRLTQEGNQNFLPSTSPDGRHVAYWSRHGYRMNLSVMDANGVNERIVRTTDQPTNHNFWTAPVWLSAEDVFFSTYSPLNDGERRFFTADIQTGTVEALPFPELLAVPRPPYRDWQVLPARNEMVFLAPGEAGNPAVLVSRPLSGGATRPIATLSVTRGQLENFLVSPDGRRIAFLSSGTWRVFDVQTRAVISALGNFGAPVDWSADGRYLLTDIGQRPTVFDTVDGKSWPLRDAAAAGINWWGDGSWSADRSFVVLSIIANREVWRQVVGMTSAEVARLAANPPRAGGQQPRR